MNVDLSLISLFTQAGLLVKTVMLILLAISMISWTLIFQRGFFLRRTEKRLNQFEAQFRETKDLDKLYEYISSRRTQIEGVEHIIKAGFREFVKCKQHDKQTVNAISGAERAMQSALAREEAKLETHLPFLANAGSVSVYIGLFGTVWGIMTAFRALAGVQQATIAMVAPGISEALVATALGLFAAIPAVFAYNRYRAKTEYLMRQYDILADEFYTALNRHHEA